MPINNGFYNRPDEWRTRAPSAPDGPTPVTADVLIALEPPLERRKRQRVEMRPLTMFVLFILLILSSTVALLLLERWDTGVPDTAFPLPTSTSAPAQEPPTTVERAPVGDGTTVTIAAAADRPTLSFQEIYQRNAACVVSVRGAKATGTALGTGVILSTTGYIITNAHVIEGCFQVEIILHDNSTHPALLVGSDAESDLAVLKINAQHLPPAEFGDSDALQVGDVALAIGNPLGEHLRGTMTDGIISAINRDVVVDTKKRVFIQTTAALNSGNSGGALINVYGQVIGITSLKMISNYDTIEGLGFAIPSTTVKAIVDELIASGHISGRPTIGVIVAALTREMAEYYGAPQGARVNSVEVNSDAYVQGLQVGDIIVEANGQAVLSGNDLNAIKDPLSVGDTMVLKVYRDRGYFTLHVKLVEKYTLDP